MPQTRPTGEQLRFLSQLTGDHVLDAYLEAAEKGGRTLPDLLDDLFDASGVFRSANFEFRLDPATNKLQIRVGNFATSTAGWMDITSFFKFRGDLDTSQTYTNFDFVVAPTTKDVYLISGLTTGQTTSFATESDLTDPANPNTAKFADVSQAQVWATKTDGPVQGSEYSAKYHAQQAAGSASAAATKASEAESSASTAAASETNAAASASAAATSESNAATSETNAATSESNAATSASAASTSESNAANSASAAATSESNASTSESNAATSESNAATSESNAATAESNASTSANDAQAARDKAQAWAETAEDTEVETGQYSAKHHSAKASASEANAATSASEAATSANEAAASASDIDSHVTQSEAARDAAQGYRDEAQGHANTAASEAADALSAVSYQDLTALAESKADTAVDVFIYDTSQDSDGGAWRKRCQHTSWYNEPLNTATRGGRKEFPAVAVIVAENDRITIYDGDVPSLPMWMVVPRGINHWFRGGRDVKSVVMLNGKLAFGTTNNSNTGLHTANFLSDVLVRYESNMSGGAEGGIAPFPLADRSIGGSPFNFPLIGSEIASESVNDVAMTVLPDAPVDPATGLPVPTIAMATDKGTSVINNDGSVHDSNPAARVTRVAFASDGTLYALQETSGNRIYTYIGYEETDGFGLAYDYIANSPPGYLKPGQPMTAGRGREILFEAQNLGGLARVLERPDQYSQGMVLRTNTAYCTGYMPANIKGAFLADTDDTDLVGSGELVTNGDGSSATDWDPVRGIETVTSTGGRIRATLDSDGTGGAVQAISGLTVGEKYVVQMDGYNGSDAESIFLRFQDRADLGGFTNFGTGNAGADVSGTATYEATATTMYVGAILASGETGGYVEIDNISVKRADPDRSVNANGLIVNGTITRTPVATGADLVGYSGFSGTNYLEQPYNADLDFGTGDFCVMGWLLRTGSNNDRLLERSGWDGAAHNGPYFRMYTVSDKLALSLSDTGSTISTVDSSKVLPHGAWTHFVFIRVGDTVSLYLNGSFDSSKLAGNFVGSFDNPNAKLVIGKTLENPGAGAPQTNMALLRISATAPTPEQIKRIYEDEKVLFQENAACTLYGSSDEVTALAHDPVTDLLHVGTSAGRSVFQGLRRVENTTTGVTDAISANNGMVAEQ